MNKIFKKTIYSLAIISAIILSGCNNSIEQKFIALSNQVGIHLGNVNSLAGSTVAINNKDYIVKTGIKENIVVSFESFGVNPNYKNSIIINDSIVHTIEEFKTQGSTSWSKTSFEILGLNAIKGQPLNITFKSGGLNNYYPDVNKENIDDFNIRNVFITIKGDKQEIWSNQFDKINYNNYQIQFCEGDKTTDQRFTCNLEKDFTFTIPDKYFNIDGVIVDSNLPLGQVSVKIKNEIKKIDFNAKAEININLVDNEIVENSKTITLSSSIPLNHYKAFLNGVPITLPLTLTKDYWSVGSQILNLYTQDVNGFKQSRTINFTIVGQVNMTNPVSYEVFNHGPSFNLPTTLINGVKNTSNATISKNSEYITSSFGNNSYQTFTINNASINTPIRWIGQGPVNKPLVLYVYNHTLSRWDALSTSENKLNQEVTLATYITEAKYIKDNKINVMVASIENTLDKLSFNSRILWLTDTQYLAEKDDYRTGLVSLGNWIENNAINQNIKYIFHTGDLVQLNTNLNQWEASHNLLVSKIINTSIPFGISTGNHDIGALNAVCSEGSNCPDEKLDYSQYWYYYSDLNTSGNFMDNRSHYNLVSIEGVEFIFLHLGWGSSITGIYVSQLDIAWANQVLSQYHNRVAVVTSHVYLNRHGVRTTTGDYLFNNLIKNHPNVKMVFSGHLHGSALLVDSIDDNNDGVGDRQLIQVLTNFQEDPFGATYFRLLNLDKTNNKIYFQTYSPYFKNYDHWDVGIHSFPSVDEFTIHFDLNNLGYGLKSNYFG